MITSSNDRPPPALDIDAVRTFKLVADLQSFTRAAQASGTTQSAVSLKLKRLEKRLSVRLVERTPRLVRLTVEGTGFLAKARDLLAAHDHALSGGAVVQRRLKLGISDHVAGSDLPDLLARLNAADPNLRLEVRLDFSNQLIDLFDRGKLDAVIVRRESHRRGGEVLREDEFGWFAVPGFGRDSSGRIRVAMLAAPCGVRAQAIHALDKAKTGWIEAFTGGGVTAVAAAAASGVAVAPLARRVAPRGTVDVGPVFGLPSLGRSKVMLHARVNDRQAAAALRTVAATFRGRAVK
jgi:DNA-binding transcriptional LysR family regulator